VTAYVEAIKFVKPSAKRARKLLNQEKKVAPFALENHAPPVSVLEVFCKQIPRCASDAG
jgi:hypothetical protein